MKQNFFRSLVLVNMLFLCSCVPALGSMGTRDFIKLCGKGPASEVAIALKAGSDPSAAIYEYGTVVNNTALMAAVRGKQSDIVLLLLKAGVKNIDAKDIAGFTALHRAAWIGLPKAVEALLKAGADPNLHSDIMYTPLITAAREGHSDIVKVLIKNGADINAINNYGLTALMEAAQGGHADVILTLLDAGADVSIKTNYFKRYNSQGERALELAKDNKKLLGTEALKRLEEASR